MTNIQYYKSYAKRLYDNNFFPIPIVPGGKRPAIKEWSKINELDEDSYKKILNRYDDHGIGILLGNICAIDIDILDKKLSFKVTEFIKNFLGEAPTRIG